MRLADLCDLVESWLLDGRDDEGRAAFLEALHAPLADPNRDLRRLLGV